MPFGARRPVENTSRSRPVLSTLITVPWCSFRLSSNPRPPPRTGPACRTRSCLHHPLGDQKQSHGTRGGVDEIAEVVVQVGFAVVVEVDQAGDLVFAVDEDLSIPNRQSQSFEQAGGESLPADLAHFTKAFHKPDITIPSADGGGVVVDKVESTNAHVRVPGGSRRARGCRPPRRFRHRSLRHWLGR